MKLLSTQRNTKDKKHKKAAVDKERTDLMNIKEYLNQIKSYETKLEITRKEIRLLKNAAINTASGNIGEKIQSSLKGDKVADNVVEYSDIEAELAKMERYYYYQRMKIVNHIFKLTDALHIKILYKKYVEFKTIGIIAKEMKFAEQYIKEEHTKAKKELEEILGDEVVQVCE